MKTYSVEEARDVLGTIVIDASRNEPSLITYHGIPCAIVIPAHIPQVRVADGDGGTASESHGH
jgi:antitoxin (DNA-binding transcriptional repressor) of toxin-antitoxin stability system